MKYLITYYSNTGNTKKVVDRLALKLEELGDVKVKNVLTATSENIEWADVIIIGSPIHGYIFFGQKFCSQVENFIKNVLPKNLDQKQIILFATYLFYYGKALKKVAKSVSNKNANILGEFAEKRNKPDLIVNQILAKLVV